MEKPRFQFRLRTLFVIMTVVALLVAVAVPVAGYVIRVRDEAREKELERLVNDYELALEEFDRASSTYTLAPRTSLLPQSLPASSSR